MNDQKELSLAPGVKAVITAVEVHGIDHQLRVFNKPARHAGDAACMLGCPLGAVVKSLIFQEIGKGQFALVLVSGKNRVDVEALCRVFGEKMRQATPHEVKEHTGYSVGSVPPFGIKGDYPVIIDADLLEYEHIWAAAGAENILIRISCTDFLYLTNGQIEIIRQAKQSSAAGSVT